MKKEKEKINRQLIFQVHPSLYEQFSKACESNYRKMPDVLREMMLDYCKKHDGENLK
jgi:hypothetical protein